MVQFSHYSPLTILIINRLYQTPIAIGTHFDI